MKLSTTAALWSAFVFPGVGLLYLKHYGRALVFMIPALLAMGYLLFNIWRIAQGIADQLTQDILATGRFAISITDLLAQVHAAIAANPALEQAQWVFVAAWAISIVSSYSVGRLKEQALAAQADEVAP